MEHKHKLLATASSQAEGACADYTVDRLTNVPREVAHHILSLVNFRDLTRLGSVSKRCRDFFLSAPSLKFSSSGNRQQQLNLLNCMDRYMLRRGDDQIKSFCINWDFSAGISEEVFRMMTWVFIAVRCNVEVLDLELRLNEKDRATLELPCCIYCCGSMRSLSVKTCTILKAPSFACSNNLQHLKLIDVRMDQGFGKWISYSCKCIKDIWLEDVRVDSFTIESSSLESFTVLYTYNSEPCHFSILGEKLVEMNIQWEVSQGSGSNSLNVFAPNLKYLKWIGNLLNYQNFGKFMCLEKALIFLKHQGDDYDFDNAFEVLCSLYRVKSLVLSEATAKVKIYHPSEATLFLQKQEMLQ